MRASSIVTAYGLPVHSPADFLARLDLGRH